MVSIPCWMLTCMNINIYIFIQIITGAMSLLNIPVDDAANVALLEYMQTQVTRDDFEFTQV